MCRAKGLNVKKLANNINLELGLRIGLAIFYERNILARGLGRCPMQYAPTFLAARNVNSGGSTGSAYS